MIFTISFIFQALFFSSCQKAAPEMMVPFDSIPSSVVLKPMIPEISGVADSRSFPGHFWCEEDSGNPPVVHLVSRDGTVVRSVFLKGITNRDWEDIGLYNGKIFIAETGDNDEKRDEYAFYTFAEPSESSDTVDNVQSIRFKYPDDSHDAEAFLVDAQSKDIFVITKRDSKSRLYKIAFPYKTDQLNVAEFVGALPYTGVVSAAISPDGKEILVKTYTNIFYYSRTAGESIGTSLQKSYKNLPYKMEPKGEAVSFALDGSGFFTVSEKGFASSVNVNFYNRK